ncbi:arylesterase [uncultured Sulfitobacter sp.]|uniref:arylesterase n=1 Tax=uncultured Sulfitobacter sp. TaxID=191468 RepID=UPI0026191DA9|nr:arylesterase [uncultured Sulfitobacter sp.]
MRKALTGILMVWASFAQAGEVVIAALGDSLTQGYGLMQSDGFVPQLETWLEQQGADVRLVNAGVSGDTTAGGLSRVDWTLTPDVDAMIVALGGNDLLRGLSPEQARSNLEGILKAAEAADVEVLLIGLDAPGNYGAEYKQQFDAIYPELAEAYGTGYLQSFFAGLVEEGETADPAKLGAWFQADGIHPNPDGVKRIVTAIGPLVLELIENVEAVD